MSEDRKDKESDDSVAKHLAEKRKALDLRTRPMEVIDDLDWDIPDLDDDDEDLSPPSAEEDLSPPAEEKVAVQASDEDNFEESTTPAPTSVAERQRLSGGTMMMSANAFREAMDDESPGSEDEESIELEEPKEDSGVSAAGATVAMSTGSMSEDDETTPAAEEPAAAEPTEEAAQTRATSAGGTMLLGGDAMRAEMERQAAESAEKTPYEEMAEQAEERHHQAEAQAPAAAASANEAVASADGHVSSLRGAAGPGTQGTATDKYRAEVPRSRGNGLLIGAALGLGIGIIILLGYLFGIID